MGCEKYRHSADVKSVVNYNVLPIERFVLVPSVCANSKIDVGLASYALARQRNKFPVFIVRSHPGHVEKTA